MFPVLFAFGDLLIFRDIPMDQTTDFFMWAGVFSLIKVGVAARRCEGDSCWCLQNLQLGSVVFADVRWP